MIKGALELTCILGVLLGSLVVFPYSYSRIEKGGKDGMGTDIKCGMRRLEEGIRHSANKPVHFQKSFLNGVYLFTYAVGSDTCAGSEEHGGSMKMET